MDIDIDICPSKRPVILDKIREERKQYFDKGLPQWAYDNLGCTLVATFGTEKTKSAILTACRGYRSEECPDGIDISEAQYMSSLVPQERGFLWTIDEVVHGDQEKGRKPVIPFLNEVNKYPGLLDIITSIEGLIKQRGSHASGVIFFEDDPFNHSAFMKTPSGDIITQFDLHDAEYMGLTKYDFLVTEVQDKLVQTIELLQDYGEIEKNLSLKEIYNKYFHPSVLPRDDKKIWDALGNVSVINTFQFDSQVGAEVAKKLKPRNVLEMSAANGLMRLMGEEGEERPLEKYARQKADISLWYKEMDRAGLTKEEEKVIEPYFKADFGVPPDQENLMLMLMDKDICGFSLKEANAARKIVGKKQMNKIPELKEKVLSQAKSEKLGQYIWKRGVGPQMGYSFSRIHSLAYSFIGIQTLYIATHWNPIFWNTACLIVNSGGLENKVEDDEEEGKSSSTDYAKLAKAVGDILSSGIKVSLVDINKSDFTFKPDIENNQILFGLKALLNVNDETVKDIIVNRPYTNIQDFYERVKPKKGAMVSLIKGGAFDNMMDRIEAMKWFIWTTCDKKEKITMQNMEGLIKNNLLLDNKEAFRIYNFNKYLKTFCYKDKKLFHLDERAINFLIEIEQDDLIDSDLTMNPKVWDKVYKKYMLVYKDWIAKNQKEILNNLNTKLFNADWEKYAAGTISAWEMEALCFYYHDHELKDINNSLYGFVDFFKLPEEPKVDKYFERGDVRIPIYKLNKICGTCIAKNKNKSSVSLLTTSGVVNVKFRKEYFSMFDKQISEPGTDGKNHIVEKSWFNRGSMIMVQGIRSGDNFVAKNYKSTGGHQLYKIENINSDGTLELKDCRYGGEQ